MKAMMFLIALLSVAVIPAPAQQAVRVTGMYSAMHYVAQAGDVIGTEIFMVVSRSGHSAVVQASEGSPGVPAVVPVIVFTGKVTVML